MEQFYMTYRLSSNMPNQSRANETEDLKRKYFFVVEGAKTEVLYFNALADRISKNSLTEVLVLERIKESESNQLKITQTIEKYIEQSKIVNSKQEVQLTDLLNELEEELLGDNEANRRLKTILGSVVDDLFVDKIDEIKEQLYTLRALQSYSENFDYICIVIDRDFQSFKEEQYDEVIEICVNNGFLLGVTNPNFEFYLLLHLTDGIELDERGLKLNYKISNKYNYVQKQLAEYMNAESKQYRKNQYDASFFLERFPVFQKNIVNYVEENIELKNKVGSSLHKIIKQLM